MVNPLQIESYSWENHLQISHFRLPQGGTPQFFESVISMNYWGHHPAHEQWKHPMKSPLIPCLKSSSISSHQKGTTGHVSASRLTCGDIHFQGTSVAAGRNLSCWRNVADGDFGTFSATEMGIVRFKHHKMGKMEDFSVQWDGSQ